MSGASGNRATITTSGTFGTGAAADVATLNRAQNVLLNTDGTGTFQGNLTTPSQTCTGTITTLNLVAQKTGGGTGGDITAQGNLLVNGNATVDGDLLIKGTSEFSATVGGAGEVSIGDVDADTVNIKGDVLFNPTYAAATPPATVGPLTATQFILDQSEAKFGFFEFEPKSEVDITGRLHNTGDAFLASTLGETLHVNRDQETYTTPTGIVLDVNGNAAFTGYVDVIEGAETSPSLRFATSSVVGLYSHNVSGSEYGVAFTNESGNILQVNKGEVKFYRNAEWISTIIDQTTVVGGSGYVPGQYNSVSLTGGSGSGFIGSLTVAFDTTITTAGAGYTDAEYVNVNLTAISTALAGALQTITIVNSGSDFVTGTYTNVPVIGGSGSSGTVDITVSGGGITQIVPNVVGSGYSQGESISVSTSNIGGSQLSSVTITNGGSNYTDGTYLGVPLVNTQGSGTNATANITVASGIVTTAAVETNGGGYTLTDTFTVDADDITVTTITGTTISGAGTGYTNGTYNGVATTMTNTRDGDQGTGAKLDITVTGNQATGATITSGAGNSGTNYKVGDTLEVSVTDVGGAGAGVLGSVSIYVAGSGLVDGTTTGVALTGGSGSGAQATVEVVSGAVTEVTITNGGLGYATTDQNIGLTGYSGVILYAATLTNPTGMQFTVSSVSLGSGLVLDASSLITGSGTSLTIGTVASGSGGSSGQATLVVNNGAVESAVVTNGGTGYSIGDTLRVNDADMLYTDAGGQQLTSATPTQQMLLTITQVGSVTVVTAVDNGEGYKATDVLTAANSQLGGTGSGFTLTIDSILSLIHI